MNDNRTAEFSVAAEASQEAQLDEDLLGDPSARTVAGRLAGLSPAKRALLDAMLARRSAAGDLREQPIPRRPRGEAAPLSFTREIAVALSFGQERLWFLDRLTPGDTSYVMSLRLRFEGRVDVAAMERAVKEIVQRHEVLRTTCALVDGRVVGIVHEEMDATLVVTRSPPVPEAERAAAVQREVALELGRPFDLEAGPLLRARLFELEGESVLLLSMHHIVSDAWTMSLLRAEIGALYDAFREGRPSPLPEPSIQYADYAAWQRRWLEGERLDRELAYFRAHLEGAPRTLELPTRRPRPASVSSRGARSSIALSAELSGALSRLGQREGATLFMTLLAALDVLLHRYTGERDLVVGMPIAGRTRAETEGMVGFFVNTLALRTVVSEDESFYALLRRVREVCLGAYAHQDLPFERLVQALAPQRDLGSSPLFQVFFNMNEAGGGPLQEPDASDIKAKFDLTLYARRDAGGIGFNLVYRTELFEPEQMDLMLEHLREVLEGIVADPGKPLSAIRLSRPAGRLSPSARVKGSPGRRFVPFPVEASARSIPARFQEQVRRHATRPAVRTPSGEVSYAELAALADRAAGALVERLREDQPRVALLFEHDAAMIAGILGALGAGKTYVPLDPASPPERLAWMIEDADVSAILTSKAGASRARALAPPGCAVLDLDALPPRPPSSLVVPPETAAYILYTSGSTGRPKGVVQSHGNVLRHIRNYTNGLFIDADDRLSLLSSYSFDAAVMDIFGALLNGATLCPIDLRGTGLVHLEEQLSSLEVTVYHSTPTVYRHLVERLEADDIILGIRRVVLGGERVLSRDVAAFKRHFPEECIFVNGFGPTESTLALQCYLDRGTTLSGEAVPVGYPVGDTEVLLLHGAGEQVALYGAGEIAVRSPQVALGYWRRPEATLAAFSTEGGVRTYRTGDQGRLLPDGSIEVSGRNDDQIKIRGYRIELGEIEARLLAHPRVREAAVAAREDGAGSLRLCAYVVAAPSASGPPTAVELQGFLRASLPEWMVPPSFTSLSAMPLTRTGKVDRRALPAPQDLDAGESHPVVAPRDAIEARLVAVWREVLPGRHPGVTDDFFAVGGHSLLAVQMIAEIERAFGKAIPLIALFQAPTIEKLAALLRERDTSRRWSALVAIKPVGSRRPLFLVSRPNVNPLGYVALARHLDPEQPVYGLQGEYPEEHALGRPYAQVEYDAWARTNIELLRTVQPEGPYLLCGMCEGAIIAFAMARQLEAEGDEIALFGVLDTWPVENTRSPLLHRVYVYGRALRVFSPPRLASRARFWSRLGALGRRLLSRTRRAAPADPWAAAMFRGADFDPPKTACPITLFRVRNQPFWRTGDYDLEWRKRTSASVEVHEVAGDHRTLLREPHVGVLAQELGACLTAAEARSARRASRQGRG